jgi:ADP-glucose pyrophosphorylase
MKRFDERIPHDIIKQTANKICFSEDDIYDKPLDRIFTEDNYSVPQYVGKKGKVINSIVNQGAVILGDCDACVISSDVLVEKGAKCDHTVIMSGAVIKEGAVVHNAIVGPNAVIEKDEKVTVDSDTIVLVS